MIDPPPPTPPTPPPHPTPISPPLRYSEEEFLLARKESHDRAGHTGGLETRRCQQIKQLQVCSHQAAGSDVGLRNGSLAAFTALWKAGIRCYDMDVTAVRDAVLVTHPKRLQACEPALCSTSICKGM